MNKEYTVTFNHRELPAIKEAVSYYLGYLKDAYEHLPVIPEPHSWGFNSRELEAYIKTVADYLEKLEEAMQ